MYGASGNTAHKLGSTLIHCIADCDNLHILMECC